MLTMVSRLLLLLFVCNSTTPSDTSLFTPSDGIFSVVYTLKGCSVARCWTQAQKGPGLNRSRDAVG